MTRRRIIALAAVWTAPALVFLGMVHFIQGCYRIDVPSRLSHEARVQIVDHLRAAFESGAAAAAATPLDHPELSRSLPGGGPVVVQAWLSGTERGRVAGRGDTLRAAVADAAAQIAVDPKLNGLVDADRVRARLKVDVVVGRGHLEDRFPLLDLVTVHPGVDGIGVAVSEGEYLLLPDELIHLNALMKKRPFPVVPEFALGLDRDKTEQVLATRTGLAGKWKDDVQRKWLARDRSYFRIRTDAFVESPPAKPGEIRGPPLPLDRGVPPGPEPTAANLRTAALLGAKYLEVHLQPNGRYLYEVNLTTGGLKGGYSIPRHAGTTYFMAEIFRITKEPWLEEPIERAFGHLAELIAESGCKGTLPDGEEYECVADKGRKDTDLGSSALAVVSLAEYQRATGKTTYEPMARRLAAWILMMQRPDGSWRHKYDIANRRPDDVTQMLYFSGEAALAMARMYEVTGEQRYAVAAEKGLDWLVDWYDFFAGGFFFGEEHWTCIASEASFAFAPKQKYLDFCNGYAEFLRNQQANPGDFPSQPDLVGSYNVTPFVMPNNTPAGSRTEAMISTYQLGVHHGRPEPVILKQILAALRFGLRQQIRPESDYAVAAKASGLGGVPGSPVDRSVRIDYVQHVCSAMIRASELVD